MQRLETKASSPFPPSPPSPADTMSPCPQHQAMARRRTKVLLALREEGGIPKRRHQLTETSHKTPHNTPLPLSVWLSLVRSWGSTRPGPCPPLLYKTSRQMKNKQTKNTREAPTLWAKRSSFHKNKCLGISTRGQIAESTAWPH